MEDKAAVIVDVEAQLLREGDIVLQAGTHPLLVVDVMNVPDAELCSVRCKVEGLYADSIYRIWPMTQTLHVARWEA